MIVHKEADGTLHATVRGCGMEEPGAGHRNTLADRFNNLVAPLE
jgi:hypothetical protein